MYSDTLPINAFDLPNMPYIDYASFALILKSRPNIVTHFSCLAFDKAFVNMLANMCSDSK